MVFDVGCDGASLILAAFVTLAFDGDGGGFLFFTVFIDFDSNVNGDEDGGGSDGNGNEGSGNGSDGCDDGGALLLFAVDDIASSDASLLLPLLAATVKAFCVFVFAFLCTIENGKRLAEMTRCIQFKSICEQPHESGRHSLPSCLNF